MERKGYNGNGHVLARRFKYRGFATTPHGKRLQEASKAGRLFGVSHQTTGRLP
jgi:hypothetical protein